MRQLHKLLSVVLAAMLLCSPAVAQQEERGFGRMQTDTNTDPGSTRLIRDPTGSAPTRRVRVFEIDGVCGTAKWGDGKTSDCSDGSIRSERFQTPRNEPQERWYGWYFYLPADFPLGNQQRAGGQYTLGQWHAGGCPHVMIVNAPAEDTMLYVQTLFDAGGYDCNRDERMPIADMRSLVGKWNRIEIFSRWAPRDGKFIVYLNGEEVVNFTGRTLTKGREDTIYFKYGIYHCCTRSLDLVGSYKVYYTNVRAANTREGLN